MSFFDRLFTFRQRETRAPLEDFLTELLAEWLREATAAGRINDVLKGLFQLPETRLPAPGAAMLNIRARPMTPLMPRALSQMAGEGSKRK